MRHNASRRSMMRTHQESIRSYRSWRQSCCTESYLTKCKPIVDRQVVEGLIHKNKAARHKVNLTAQINKPA
ncbi:30S ribosomal protein S20 [Salmonella enterica subsp. enterica]|nr:30S ribosomal protein S20 [Salmonella enterica subsp. enterica]